MGGAIASLPDGGGNHTPNAEFNFYVDPEAARAVFAAGFEVTLASGGAPVPGVVPPGVKLVQLPPMAAADVAFKTLLDESGRPIDDSWKERRKENLLAAWRAAKAEVLIVELFPFGRRQLRFELLPLLEAARGALVLCSVRDILQRRPEREAGAVELVEKHFQRILVHGDPRIAPFEASFSAAACLADRLSYTGYVVEEPRGAGVGDPERVLGPPRHGDERPRPAPPRPRRRVEHHLALQDVEVLVGGVVAVHGRRGARGRQLLQHRQRPVASRRRQLHLHQRVQEPQRLPLPATRYDDLCHAFSS